MTSNGTILTNEAVNNIFIDLLGDLIIQSNCETRDHITRVQNYTEILARCYSKLYPRSRMTEQKQRLTTMAARIHDVGKITMPDALLLMKGQMSSCQFNLYEKHTIKGGQIIKSLSTGRDRDFERICYNVCVYHHEKYDGSGYPYGYKENKIPIEAQIVGFADIYDTLLHSGVSENMNKNKAYYMIANSICGGISPRLINCFEEVREEIEAVDISVS